MRTPTYTPAGANGSSAIEPAMLRPTSKPIQSQGIQWDSLMTKKKTAVLAVQLAGLSRNAMAQALMGGPHGAEDDCAKAAQ